MDRNTPSTGFIACRGPRQRLHDRVPEQQLQQQRQVADHLDIDAGDLATAASCATAARCRPGCRGWWRARCPPPRLQRVQQPDGQRPQIGVGRAVSVSNSPIGRPASRLRKPKPVAMRRTSRLWTVLLHSQAKMATRSPPRGSARSVRKTACPSAKFASAGTEEERAFLSSRRKHPRGDGRRHAEQPKYFICCNRTQYMKQMFHERQAVSPQ